MKPSFVGAVIHLPLTHGGCRAVMIVNIINDVAKAASFDDEHVDHEFVPADEGLWHWPEDCTTRGAQ